MGLLTKIISIVLRDDMSIAPDDKSVGGPSANPSDWNRHSVRGDGNCGLYSMQYFKRAQEDRLGFTGDRDIAKTQRQDISRYFESSEYLGLDGNQKRLVQQEIIKIAVSDPDASIGQNFRAAPAGLYYITQEQIRELEPKLDQERQSVRETIFSSQETMVIVAGYLQWRGAANDAGAERHAESRKRGCEDLSRDDDDMQIDGDPPNSQATKRADSRDEEFSVMSTGVSDLELAAGPAQAKNQQQKVLFYQAMKDEIESEAKRRGTDPSEIYVKDIVDAHFDAIIMRMDKQADSAAFPGLMALVKERCELDATLRSPKMVLRFVLSEDGKHFPDELKKSSYYLSEFSMGLLAYKMNQNIQIVYESDGQYTFPDTCRFEPDPGGPLHYILYKGSHFEPLTPRARSGSPSASVDESDPGEISAPCDSVPGETILKTLFEIALTPTRYQENAIARLLEALEHEKSALLIAQTGLGKTLMAYITLYLRSLLKKNSVQIVLNNQKAIVEQLANDFVSYGCTRPMLRYSEGRYYRYHHAEKKWQKLTRSEGVPVDDQVIAILKDGGFFFATIDSFLTIEGKEGDRARALMTLLKRFKDKRGKVDTIFVDEAHHIGQAKKMESDDMDIDQDLGGFVDDECMDVDMEDDPIQGTEPTEKARQNKRTEALLNLQKLFKANLLGCTATPKGPKNDQPLTNVFGDPTVIIPLMEGMVAGLIHRVQTLDVDGYLKYKEVDVARCRFEDVRRVEPAPVTVVDEDGWEWEELETTSLAPAAPPEKPKKDHREAKISSYVRGMYPGDDFKPEREGLKEKLIDDEDAFAYQGAVHKIPNKTNGFTEEDQKRSEQLIYNKIKSEFWGKLEGCSKPRRTIVYCYNQSSARALCEKFKQQISADPELDGVYADYLISENSKKSEEIVSKMRNNQTHSIVFVVNMLGEGSNIPELDSAVWLKSSSPFSFLQQVGRIVRKGRSGAPHNRLKLMDMTSRVPIAPLLKWLLSDAVYAGLYAKPGSPGKRVSPPVAGLRKKEVKQEVPDTQMDLEMQEGPSSSDDDEDDIVVAPTVDYDGNWADRLMASLPSSLLFRFFKERIPEMIKAFSGIPALKKSALYKENEFVEDFINRIESRVVCFVYKQELDSLAEAMDNLDEIEAETHEEKPKAKEIFDRLKHILDPIKKGKMGPADIDGYIKKLMAYSQELGTDDDTSMVVQVAILKINELIAALNTFNKGTYQSDTELFQILLRLGVTKSAAMSWFQAINYIEDDATDAQVESRQVKNCVSACAAFIKTLSGTFVKADASERHRPTLNEDRTTTFTIDGKERVFTRHSLEACESDVFKANGKFQLFWVHRKINVIGEDLASSNQWHMSLGCVTPDGKVLFIDPQQHAVGDELNPIDEDGNNLFVITDEFPVEVYKESDSEHNPLPVLIGGESFEVYRKEPVKSTPKEGQPVVKNDRNPSSKGIWERMLSVKKGGFNKKSRASAMGSSGPSPQAPFPSSSLPPLPGGFPLPGAPPFPSSSLPPLPEVSPLPGIPPLPPPPDRMALDPTSTFIAEVRYTKNRSMEGMCIRINMAINRLMEIQPGTLITPTINVNRLGYDLGVKRVSIMFIEELCKYIKAERRIISELGHDTVASFFDRIYNLLCQAGVDIDELAEGFNEQTFKQLLPGDMDVLRNIFEKRRASVRAALQAGFCPTEVHPLAKLSLNISGQERQQSIIDIVIKGDPSRKFKRFSGLLETYLGAFFLWAPPSHNDLKHLAYAIFRWCDTSRIEEIYKVIVPDNLYPKNRADRVRLFFECANTAFLLNPKSEGLKSYLIQKWIMSITYKDDVSFKAICMSQNLRELFLKTWQLGCSLEEVVREYNSPTMVAMVDAVYLIRYAHTIKDVFDFDKEKEKEILDKEKKILDMWVKFKTGRTDFDTMEMLMARRDLLSIEIEKFKRNIKQNKRLRGPIACVGIEEVACARMGQWLTWTQERIQKLTPTPGATPDTDAASG